MFFLLYETSLQHLDVTQPHQLLFSVSQSIIHECKDRARSLLFSLHYMYSRQTFSACNAEWTHTISSSDFPAVRCGFSLTLTGVDWTWTVKEKLKQKVKSRTFEFFLFFDGEPTKNTSNRKHLSKSSLDSRSTSFHFFFLHSSHIYSSPLFTLPWRSICVLCALLHHSLLLLTLSLTHSLLQYRLLLSIRMDFFSSSLFP